MFTFRHDTTDTGIPGVGVAFTDRHGGHSTGPYASLNLGRVGADPQVERNLEAVREALGLRSLIRVDQKHTAEVIEVTEAPDGQYCVDTGDTGADALVTALGDVGLVIRVADCVPVLLAAEDGTVIGAAHAGRVGLLAGVLTATVAVITQHTTAPLRAWIGPHICGRCYEVPPDMRADASTTLPATHATTSWGTPALDLGAGAEAQLVDLGVTVHRVDPCTLENPDDLFSHRHDAASGRQAGIIHRRACRSSALPATR